MPGIRNLSYLVLGVSDFDGWQKLLIDVLGMQVATRSDERMTVRIDDQAYRFILDKDNVDDLLAAGLQVDNAQDLEALVGRIRSCGVAIERAPSALIADRQVQDAYLCKDPNGIQLELFYGPPMARGADPFCSKGLSGKYRAGSHGLGHFHPWVDSHEESAKFYQDVLGLKLAGTMEPSDSFPISFFYGTCGAFHTIAISEYESEKRMAHIGLEIDNLNDVGFALDRARKMGVPITASLGHHPNNDATSFYMKTPSGFEIELGTGEIDIEDENWQAQRFLEYSDWGHERGGRLGI